MCQGVSVVGRSETDGDSGQGRESKLEIELETERQLSRLRVRLVADVAQHSAAAFFSAQPPEERPPCPDCAAPV